MPQNEYVPQHFRDVGQHEPSSSLCLESDGTDVKATFSLEVIANDLYRILFTSKDHEQPPWPSVPRQAPPPASANGHTDAISSESGDPRATTMTMSGSSEFTCQVDWATGPPLVSIHLSEDPKKVIFEDLPHRSYVLDGPGIAHYTRYKRNTLHVGLGEKAAPMDLSNRHFALSATDCFGYDVHRTDPLYKHIPLLINATKDYAVATFSTSHSRGYYSVGSEIDGMWGHYKVYRQDYGGLEEYLIVGKTIQEVVRKYAGLVGYPLLVPRWAFGYLAGGMKYSMLDDPRACDALMEFAGKLKEHDIPCSGFQLSSGYTVAETKPRTRNVFTWNKHRFPDPKGFIQAYREHGMRIIANIKPYILASHPKYEELQSKGAFFTDPRTNEPAQARLWSAGGGESGIGGHIDFTSKAGYEFWYNGVKELRELGIECMWNDNNEFTIPDDWWNCALDNEHVRKALTKTASKHVGLWGRFMHTELMGKASHDAVLEVKPSQRPFILTRSATAGNMRYCASTWSGDNVTSWEGMRGANALSLTASVCLLHCYGHDIGGFEGPQPSPELLVRWVQLGVHSPRFAINCFKTSPENNSIGDVIEPWMYPKTAGIIRDAIKRRYEMIPYLYSLMLKSHLFAEPPQRWTGWNYSDDDEVWNSKLLKDGETQYFLGDALLIGGVYEPGGARARVYLPRTISEPRGQQFLNLYAPYQYLEAGRWVEIESKWDHSIPVLAKVGTLLPIGRPEQVLAAGETENPANLPLDDYRAVELYPPNGSSPVEGYSNFWLEDDGISPAPVPHLKIELTYICDESSVDIARCTQAAPRGSVKWFTPPWNELNFILPVGDERVVTFKSGRGMVDRGKDSRGRRIFCASVADMITG